MRAAALAGVLAASGVLMVALPAAAAPAAAPAVSQPPTVGPVRTAWYDASYPQATPTPPPGPPGVGPDDLVVSGVTASSSVLPVIPPAGSVTRTQPTAVTALLFQIPAGAMPATLTLALSGAVSTTAADGKLPVGVTPEACPATTPFVAGGRQPWSAVPSYDCSGRTSIGQLSGDGTSVVFSDIGSVARGRTLAIVIRPGTLGGDRLVFAKPSRQSLSLLGFDAAPSYDAAGQEMPPAPSFVTPSSGTPASAADSPLLPGPLPGPSATPAGDAGPAPLLATGTSVTPSGASALARSARPAAVGTDDARTRTILLAGLVLLVQGAALLMVTDRQEAPVPVWAVLRAARRGEPLPPLPAKEWGIGRHRAPRQGPVPTL
jgi:hypothetical protein